MLEIIRELMGKKTTTQPIRFVDSNHAKYALAYEVQD